MKNELLVKRLPLLLLLSLVLASALSACTSTDEHPKSSEHPTHEHPTTNAPAQKP